MKVLRLFLVTIFMFTLFISPVQAQEGEEYGFVALVTQADAALSLRMQARRAYQRLLPDLLAAQQSGTILEFTPEFRAGILKIKFAAGARASALSGIEVLDNAQAAINLVPAQSPSGPQAAAVYDPSFELDLYNSCFYAYDLGEDSHVVGSLRDNTGRILDTFGGDADLDGFLIGCFDSDGPYGNVLPGHRVIFKIYDSLGALLGTYTAVAPTITFASFNKTTSVISGTGPKNKPFWIGWYHENLDAGATYTNAARTRTILSNGKWSVDFGTKPFRGGDEFYMIVSLNARFTFGHYFTLPHIFCMLGSNYCEISGLPLAAASLNITHAGVTHTFTGRFDESGQFGATLQDSKGAPILLTTGDRVSGTGVPAYLLPNLTAIPNFTSDRVNGKAPANKYFGVSVKDYCQCWYDVWAHSNSARSYSADFSSMLDLVAGDSYILETYYIDSLTGNVTDRHVAVGP